VVYYPLQPMSRSGGLRHAVFLFLIVTLASLLGGIKSLYKKEENFDTILTKPDLYKFS
jgi:hypothetical protein